MMYRWADKIFEIKNLICPLNFYKVVFVYINGRQQNHGYVLEEIAYLCFKAYPVRQAIVWAVSNSI